MVRRSLPSFGVPDAWFKGEYLAQGMTFGEDWCKGAHKHRGNGACFHLSHHVVIVSLPDASCG